MRARHDYVPCAAQDVPGDVRFDVPARHQGQIVEVAYGGYGRHAHDEGDLYKRIVDRSAYGAAEYYRLVKAVR